MDTGTYQLMMCAEDNREKLTSLLDYATESLKDEFGKGVSDEEALALNRRIRSLQDVEITIQKLTNLKTQLDNGDFDNE